MSEATWQNATSAHGPALIAWLEERNGLPSSEVTLGATLARKVHGLRAGKRCEFWTVDKILTKLDLHVSMVPDEVWSEASARGPGPPREIRSTRRRVEMKPRYCKRCEKEIPRGTHGKETYSVREFCSVECTKAAKGGLLGFHQYFPPKEDAA